MALKAQEPMCKEMITEMERSKASLATGTKKIGHQNSLAFFLKVNLELISFQDFSGFFFFHSDETKEHT